jgi:glutamate dehydrogenase (NADP+)
VTVQTDEFLARVITRNPGEKEFHQAVREVVESVEGVTETAPHYRTGKVLERMVEPERVLIFRVPWMDDEGEIRINRGYHVEMSSVLGPFKGGLRFHPSVNLSIMKFLAFQQTFKNSLTGLPMGGAQGGSDFDPKGKSDTEVMRFCQSFMAELHRHIGPETDVPGSDIGVGGREIGYLFGMYRKLTNRFDGVLTGKGSAWGGSLVRPEASGYGMVYFVFEMLASRRDTLTGKRVALSGSGNVAQFAAEKLIEMGARVVTMSDSNGTIVDENGMDRERLEYVKDLKNQRRGRIREYAQVFSDSGFLEDQRPWHVKCDIALPCATENELNEEEAQALLDGGCICVAEGANMPCEPAAIERLLAGGVLFGPGKAANAGGVAVSGLEMTQNSMRMAWTRQEVDQRLRMIMQSIHTTCVRFGRDGDSISYLDGANVGGFIRVADALLDQGLV